MVQICVWREKFGGNEEGVKELTPDDASGCCNLQTSLDLQYRYCSVSSPSLKRATIYSPLNPQSAASFDTPNLISLEYSDVVAAKYPRASFDSLVEASVGIRMTPDQVHHARYFSYEEEEVGDATNFLAGISNVKKLYLSSQALEVCISLSSTVTSSSGPVFFKNTFPV
ncbi:hypothetical protein Bca4012_016203 [Brassica carinata]